MKKTILFAWICTTTLVVQSQITLHSDNVAQSPTYDGNMKFQPGIRTADNPIHGASRTWDYSDLEANFSMVETYRPATRSGFTSYSRFLNGNTSVGNITLPSEYYFHLTDEGLFEVGSYQLPRTQGLVNFGNKTDTITFPGANVIFTTPAPILKFPCTFGHSWTANHIYNTPFRLSIGLYSLNNAPALWVQRVYKTDSVVGWGKLILPTPSGASSPVDVLLIKTSKYYVDSYYVNGSPAPMALLTGLSVRQNDTNHFNSYTFHAAGAELPLLNIMSNVNWVVFGFTYYTDGIFPLANYSPQTETATISPNPVQSAQLLRFNMRGIYSHVRITFLDLQGRLLYNWEGDAAGAAEGIRIPVSLSPGQYIYRIENNGAAYQHGKFMVE